MSKFRFHLSMTIAFMSGCLLTAIACHTPAQPPKATTPTTAFHSLVVDQMMRDAQQRAEEQLAADERRQVAQLPVYRGLPVLQQPLEPNRLELVAPPVDKLPELSYPPLTPRAGFWPVLCLEAVDGDTLKVAFLYEETVRLYGCNAPELHGESAAAGKKSKDWLASKLPDKPIRMRIIGREKYGRVLAELYDDVGQSLNDASIKAGMSKPWDGKGARP